MSAEKQSKANLDYCSEKPCAGSRFDQPQMSVPTGALMPCARMTALQVTADALVGRKASAPRANGPTGKARRLFEAVSKLPRRQQEKIAEFVEAFVNQHTTGKAA
jgi:hypothetical protein